MSVNDDDERIRIEQALRKSEERFRQVVESAPSAMVMIGAAGRIVMVNAQTETLGLQLVHLLTDQLGGELAVNRANPTAFVLRFPIQRMSE